MTLHVVGSRTTVLSPVNISVNTRHLNCLPYTVRRTVRTSSRLPTSRRLRRQRGETQAGGSKAHLHSFFKEELL